MELGKHKMSLEKALKIVQHFNNKKDKSQGVCYTSYAVARQICEEAGYTWTVNYGSNRG